MKIGELSPGQLYLRLSGPGLRARMPSSSGSRLAAGRGFALAALQGAEDGAKSLGAVPGG